VPVHRDRLREMLGHDLDASAIERRRREMERALGREVRFEVAALDLLPDLLDRLVGQARTDALTGTLNRRGLDRLLESEAARAKRTGEPLAVLAVDVDEFKTVNDRHGHAWGDHVLRRIAEVLLRECRASDQVARAGGDEFLVVLPATSNLGAQVAARRIQRALEGLDLLEGCPTRRPLERVTVSIGVASGLVPGELAARADSALYAAKRAGRNRSVVA